MIAGVSSLGNLFLFFKFFIRKLERGTFMKGMIFFSLVTLFVLVLSINAGASDVTAKSCSAADIQTAINNCISTGGGTVTVPACNQTWNNGDCLYAYSATNELRVLGAGRDGTIITYG